MERSKARGWVATLWVGETPLPVAFWRYGIVYGLAINAAATLAALILFAMDAPDWLGMVAYLAPTPYNLLVLVGVWRATARWRGPPHWASVARVAIALWTAAALAL